MSNKFAIIDKKQGTKLEKALSLYDDDHIQMAFRLANESESFIDRLLEDYKDSGSDKPNPVIIGI